MKSYDLAQMTVIFVWCLNIKVLTCGYNFYLTVKIA